VPRQYVPDRGDIVWLHLNPQAGHEQTGRHPALVLSPALYNKPTGLMLCCPLTAKIKGYPFEVAISGQNAAVALADRIKSLDWRVHRAEYKGKAAQAEVADVLAKAYTLLK